MNEIKSTHWRYSIMMCVVKNERGKTNVGWSLRLVKCFTFVFSLYFHWNSVHKIWDNALVFYRCCVQSKVVIITPFFFFISACDHFLQNVNGIKYHAKNGHRTQIRVRKPFKCRCGKSYKTSQGLRHHTINFHPPVSTEILRKIQG